MRIRDIGVDEKGLTRRSGLLQQLFHMLLHQGGILATAAEFHIPGEFGIRLHVRMLVNHRSEPASLLQQCRQGHSPGIDRIESQPTAAMRHEPGHDCLTTRLTNRHSDVMIPEAMCRGCEGVQCRSGLQRVPHPAR